MEKEIQKSMSCRKVVARYLPILLSVGKLNERNENGRPRTETFRGISLFNNNPSSTYRSGVSLT